MKTNKNKTTSTINKIINRLDQANGLTNPSRIDALSAMSEDLETITAAVKSVTAKRLPDGGYSYSATFALHGEQVTMIVRKKATNLYDKAYIYARPITRVKGIASFITFGTSPWAESEQWLRSVIPVSAD